MRMKFGSHRPRSLGPWEQQSKNKNSGLKPKQRNLLWALLRILHMDRLSLLPPINEIYVAEHLWISYRQIYLFIFIVWFMFSFLVMYRVFSLMATLYMGQAAYYMVWFMRATKVPTDSNLSPAMCQGAWHSTMGVTKTLPQVGSLQNSITRGFPGSAAVKNPPANAGDTGSIPRPGWSHMPRNS